MSKASVLIRKYGDRRLYDTAASRYVTLNELARLIRKGADVEVREARTGKNVTSVILTQIIVDEARDTEGALPLHLLHQLVRATDRSARDFVTWYVNNTLELFQKAQGALGEKLGAKLGEARMAATSPIEYVRHLLAGVLPEGSDVAERERLKRKAEELENRLAAIELGARKARKRAAGKPRKASARKPARKGVPAEPQP